MNQRPLRRVVVGALLVLCLGSGPALGQTHNSDDTLQAAVFLLHSAMSPTPNGDSVQLLRALRQLGDPALEPYFNQLYQSASPVLKIHGILGLAECSKEKHIDLTRLTMMTDKDALPIEAEMVDAAMDSDLLSNDQARQLVDSKGTDDAIKVLVSAQLVKKNLLPSLQPLRQAAKSALIVQRTVALVLLLQSGDPTAMRGLEEIDHSDDPKRDKAREMALERVLRYDYDAAGPWALTIARQPDISPRMRLMALRAALRYAAPGAPQEWRHEFEASTDIVDRMRLALMALQLSPWLPADFYQPLVKSDDPFVRQLGLTSMAVAQHKQVAAAMSALINYYNPIADNWALAFAHKEASPDDARIIYMRLIHAADEGGETNRPQRIDDAMLATQMLCEAGPADAAKLLRPVLTDAKTSPELAQSILVGLISAQPPGPVGPQCVIDGISFDNIDTSNLALLLKAKAQQPLAPAEMEELSVLVRGGGGLPESLRIQAAWDYLKITRQTKEALAEVLAADP